MTVGHSKSQRQFTGRHMFIVMLVFFGVIISVNVTMAVMASRSWTGLVVKNSYVASQKFNANLQAAREQRQRGWISSLGYTHGQVKFTMGDRHGRPLVIENLTLSYGRPAFEQADKVVPLTHIGKGVYEATAGLKAGIWAITITGGKADRPYRRESRLVVTSDGQSGKEE